MKNLRVFRICTLVVLSVCAAVSAYRSWDIGHQSYKDYYEQFPSMTKEQLSEKQRQVMQIGATHSGGTSPYSYENYYNWLYQYRMLIGSYERERFVNPPKATMTARGTTYAPEPKEMIDLRRRMEKIEQGAAMVGSTWHDAGNETQASAKYMAIRNSYISWQAWSYIALQWIVLLGIGIIPMGVCFTGRIRDAGCSVSKEVQNGRLQLMSVVWAYGMLYYHTTPTEQARNVGRMLGTVLGFVLTITAFSAKAFGQERKGDPQADSPPTWEFSLTTITLPKFVGDDGAIFHPGAVQHTSFDAVHTKSGAHTGAWLSEPLTQRGLRPLGGRELDLSIGVTRKFRKWFLWDVTATYFNIFPLTQMPREDQLELAASVEKSFQINKQQQVTPYVKVREVWPVKGTTPEGGVMAHAGVRYQLEKSKFTVNVAPELVYDDGAFGLNPGWIGRLNVRVKRKLTHRMSVLFPVVQATVPITNTNDGRKFQFVVGGGLAWNW